MISKPITAPFRCWAKGPWIVFWGITLLVLVSTIIPLGHDFIAVAYAVVC